METRLLVGAACIATGIITIAICYLGARNPRQPKWACEAVMANILVPAIVGCLAIGPMLIAEYIFTRGSEMKLVDLVLAAIIIAASVVCVKLLRIKKRVAAYEQHGPGSKNDRFTNPHGGNMGVTTA